jgi:signal transduction histidine kinase
MNRSIRLRIAFSVLAVVALCQVALSLFVLDRLAHVQRDEVDELLREELAEVAVLLGTPQLEALIAAESARNTKWNETFFEVRDARGVRQASSQNVPAAGLARLAATGEASEPVIWESRHPRSRRGHVRIRVLEARIDGHSVLVGRSLKRYQKLYWRLRERLAFGLLGVAALGALCAWGVAAYSLRPIGRIAARAAALGGSLEGELPSSGRGDELDRLARVLNELLARIRSEVARVRRMTADVAHALRTPLTALRGTLEVQLAGGDRGLGAKLAPALESIDELGRLVNRLLWLERIEARGRALRSEPVQLDKLATELVDAVQVVAGDHGIELTLEAWPVAVAGDRAELREAILNLLDNALRHTPRGGRVAVRVAAERDLARLSVADSGPGLPRERPERIFERFYSTTPSGSGLGLPIARAVAEAHGGSLETSCSALGGARFELTLPLAKPPRS